ncbi:MAG TPA: EamA family transporter [Bradyrhizobium sp.]|nr:EamA family transporter [Bradyrhizobium sp.]
MKPFDVFLAVLVAVIWGLAFVAPWLCLVPPLPLAFAIDGPQATWHALWQMSPTGWVSILFIGAVSTSIAYWLCGRLLRDYTAAQVVPFALLVPFVGAGASSVVFGETFGPLRLTGMVTVVGGIAIMLLSKRPQVVPKQVLPKQVLPEIA